VACHAQGPQIGPDYRKPFGEVWNIFTKEADERLSVPAREAPRTWNPNRLAVFLRTAEEELSRIVLQAALHVLVVLGGIGHAFERVTISSCLVAAAALAHLNTMKVM
jgi:hypothetical protein